MTRFHKQYNCQSVQAMWESDIKYWLAVCKEIFHPTYVEINKWDKVFNSGKADIKDIKSFCRLTGWKVKR